MGIPVSDLAFAAASLLAAGASPTPLRFVPAPGSPISVGGGPNGVEAADLNGDAKLDLVATNGRSNVILVLLGDGRGGFTPASPVEVSAPPHLSAVGDLDGDRKPDLVATSHDSHSVFVWRGDGRGRFVPAAGSPFPALSGARPHNHGLALGDVDGDGDLDILTADDVVHAVAVLLNDGRGVFAPPPASPFGVGREPYPLALADVNKDGRLDVVTPNVGGASISLLVGDGRGGFTPGPGTPIAVASRPYYAALGDVNGDGALDVVTSHDDVSLVSVLIGDGRGRFRQQAGSPVDVGRRSWKVVLTDLDRDGRQDVVLGAGGAVVVRRGDGRGRFLPVPGSPFPAGRGSWSVAVADFDGDGKSDIATADVEAGTLTILLQR